MFDTHIVQPWRFGDDQRKVPESLIVFSANCLNQDIVNAVAAALGTESSGVGGNVSNCEPAAHIHDLDGPNRNVRHHATRALVSLACRHENNREAGLRKTAP